ncbi:MAG: hypothetical protein JNM82_04735 [Rhodocyclaceae bacterium]|nr:hypothetical protein [Rhodocyclaceae bacterium]
MRSPFPVLDVAAAQAGYAQEQSKSGSAYRDSHNRPLSGPSIVPPVAPVPFFFRSGPGPRPDMNAGLRVKDQVTARRWSGCRRIQFG